MTLIRPHRRDVLRLSAGAALLGATAHFGFVRPAAAKAPQADAQTAGYYRFNIGKFEITIVSDGSLTIPAAGLGANQKPEDVAAFLSAHRLDPKTAYAHTNITLINTGEKLIICDVGSGAHFQDTAGRLVQNLEAAGVKPEDIDIVAFTHLHPDHAWGLLDDMNEAVFPKAEIMVMAPEYEWWMAKDLLDKVPDGVKPFVAGAQRVMKPFEGKVKLLKDGDEIAPGVSFMSSPGHTPGHGSVMVQSEGAKLLVLGDSISHAFISFEKPDWVSGFDAIPEQVVKTRKGLLDIAVKEDVALVGYHFPFPGVGMAMAAGEAYRFVPAAWRWDL